MSNVEVMQYQGAVLLRARGSELIILPNHVHELQNAKEPKAFAQYFLSEALVNRPARKLFDSWLRKDSELWKRIFHLIHKDMEKVNLEDNPIVKAMAQKEAERKSVATTPAGTPAGTATITETTAKSEHANAAAEESKPTRKVRPKPTEKNSTKTEASPAASPTASPTASPAASPTASTKASKDKVASVTKTPKASKKSKE